MPFNELLTMLGETFLMTILSTFFAYLLGLPIGVILNITSKGGLRPNRVINFILGGIVNILRSIPCLIIIVICIPVTRLLFNYGTGYWYTILIPLVVASVGFVSRMVEQSLQDVPYGEIEAIKSLGATDFQIVTKVLLPEARVSLITGVAVVLVNVIGYTSFAYNIGAGGLISGIYSFYRRNSGNYMSQIYFWMLIILVIVLVEGIQELGLFVAKKLDKRRKNKWKT